MVDKRWLVVPAALGALVASSAGVSAGTDSGSAGEPNLGDGSELTWSPDGAKEIEFDLDALPAGKEPTVAYHASPEGARGMYRYGDAAVEGIPASAYTSVAGGELVIATDEYGDDPEVPLGRYLFQADGGHELVGDPAVAGELGTGAVASADGAFAAWQFEREGTSDTSVSVADGHTGDLLATVDHDDLGPWDPEPNRWHSRVVGMLDDRVLIHPSWSSKPPGEDMVGPARIWDPDTGAVELLEGTAGATGTNGSDLAVVEWGDVDNDWDTGDRFTSVLDTANGNTEQWHSAELGVRAYAPDNAHLAVEHHTSDFDYYWDGVRTGIVDAESEEFVLTFGPGVYDLVWESPDTVLISVLDVEDGTNNASNALVRCDLSGECERATPVLDEVLPEDADEAVYWNPAYQVR